MEAVKIDKNMCFYENKIGISKPVKGEKAKKQELDIIIISAIAFDYWGHRTGFGNGCYNKLLKDTKAFKIGIGFDFKMIESIHADEHNIKVNIVITDKRIISYDLDD